MDAATIEKVNKRERMGTAGEEGRTTKELLDAQQRFPVTLHQNKPGEDQLPDKYVGINGYGYQIKRGKLARVPESVYLVLVQSGEVAPQREEDEKYVPQMTYAYGDPISQQVAQNVQ